MDWNGITPVFGEGKCTATMKYSKIILLGIHKRNIKTEKKIGVVKSISFYPACSL